MDGDTLLIPIAVVTCPARGQMGTALASHVNADAICWDVGVGPAHNHLAAWKWLYETGAEWGVVLEDDVQLCTDFRRQLEQALACAPTDIVSLYLGRGRPPHWQERIATLVPRARMTGSNWIMLPEFLSAQGYAMRRHLFAHGDYLRKFYCGEGNGRVDAHPIDEGITYMMRMGNGGKISNYNYPRGALRNAEGVPALVSYAFPSIVEHRDGPTVIVHRDGPRNGPTALMTPDSDPSGATLPEIRKAWVFGPHANWDSSGVQLGMNLNTSA